MSRSYSYDSRSRISGISETIAGSTFSTTLAYDSYGRLSSRTHPSGVVETFGYNGNGYLSSVSAGGSPVYTITSMNARQQVTAATLSSSMYATYGFDSFGYPTYSKAVAYGVNKQDYRYSFNPTTGNPAYRRNYLRSLQESFSCDTLGRLTGVSGPRNLTTSYANSNGNILKKAHLADTISYAYGANAGPYAMTSVTAPNGLIPNVNQFVGYTSFEKVDTIFEAPYKARFLYNSENQRARMVVSRNDTTKLTRWYAGSRYMKETSGTTTKEYTYIGGDAYSAPIVAVTEGGTTSYYYLLRDYLGNVTHVVNSSYGISGEYSYDAWGRRRSADDWSYTLDANDTELMAGRGFTGHEHLPWFNLINMNGRLYDPVVGRFLSPDPYVQSPDFTQNFNRYSYCLNNPLIYTDPEGYTLVTQVGDWIIENWKPIVTVGGTVIVVVSVTILTAGIASPIVAGAIVGASGGFTSGAVGTWVNGGNFWQGIGSGAVNGIIGAVSGVTGGAASVWASKSIGYFAINAIEVSGKSAIGGFVFGAIGGAAGGAVGGATTGGIIGLITGDYSKVGEMTMNGAMFGGITGGIIGGYSGYKAAKALGNNPLTGKGWPTPPGKGPFTSGTPSRQKAIQRGERSLYDPDGGEWRYDVNGHQPNYDPHWDYKASGNNTPWENIYGNIIKKLNIFK